MKKTKRIRGRRLAASALAVGIALSVTGCDIYFGRELTKEECLAELKGNEFGGDIAVPGFPLEVQGTVKAENPPPPISGGTMALNATQDTVVIADSDRDRVYIVSLLSQSLLSTTALEQGDEPGRVVIDADSVAHIALRSGGAIASIDVATGTLLRRVDVCPAPRGIAVDDRSGGLYVACHGGELVNIDPATGTILAQFQLENGLRDVVLDEFNIYVSVFRTAEVIILDRAGAAVGRMQPPGVDSVSFDPFTGEEIDLHFEPAVAWRMMRNPSGAGVILLHQRGRDGKISVGRGGYGGDRCSSGVVHAAITPMAPGQPILATQGFSGPVLPVDMALVTNNSQAVITAAGNSAGDFAFFSPVASFPLNVPHDEFGCIFGSEYDVWQGQPTAVVSTFDETVAIQLREPAELVVFPVGTTWSPIHIALDAESRFDTGQAIFHMDTGAGIACASCHPEGADDGRVWDFECIGPRRTQTLQFGLLGTEPFHWDGDMDSFETLMTEVFVGRMAGGQPTGEQMRAMAEWLDTMKAPPRSAPSNPAAVERGRAIFERPDVGCLACHNGPKFMTNGSFDVGTGGTFQVPTLIGIVNRAPYIHNGCAATLRERLIDPSCGGGDRHGVVSGLSGPQIDDLVAFLQTL